MLSLFSGIAGLDLASELGAYQAGHTGAIETAAFCEIDPFCQRVLAHHWPEAPIHDDITTLTPDWLRSVGAWPIDIICGGPPCQPASAAGKRGGSSDGRWLWPAFLAVVGAVRPRWIVAENPDGILTVGAGWELAGILGALDEMGYRVGRATFAAADVGAPHQRDRVFIVAYAARYLRGSSGHEGSGAPNGAGHSGTQAVVGDARGRRGPDDDVRSGRDAVGSGGAELAHTAGNGRHEGRSQPTGQQGRSDAAQCDPGDSAPVDDAVSQQGGERYNASVQWGRSGDAQQTGVGSSYRAREPSTSRQSQPCVVPDPDGLSRRLAGLLRHAWPAGRGEAQEAHEPPRLATGVAHRAAKLRAIGNAVVPMQAAPIFAAIVQAEYERQEAAG